MPKPELPYDPETLSPGMKSFHYLAKILQSMVERANMFEASDLRLKKELTSRKETFYQKLTMLIGKYNQQTGTMTQYLNDQLVNLFSEVNKVCLSSHYESSFNIVRKANGSLSEYRLGIEKALLKGIAILVEEFTTPAIDLWAVKTQMIGHRQELFDRINASATFEVNNLLQELDILIEEEKVFPQKPSNIVTDTHLQPMDFDFIQDGSLKHIISRDYRELQLCARFGLYKATLVMAGSVLESLLLDALLKVNKEEVEISESAPKKKPLMRWDLNELLAVSRELDIVDKQVEAYSHPLRELRNLIHPGREYRDGTIFDQNEAGIAIHVVNIVIRGLMGKA